MSAGFGPGKSEDWPRADGTPAPRSAKRRRAAKRLLRWEWANRFAWNGRGFRSAGTPSFLLNRPTFDQVTANIIAESGCSGDLNRAGGGDFYGRIDDVFFPVAPAGG